MTLLLTLLAVLVLATTAAAISAYLEARDLQDETLRSVAYLVKNNQIGAPSQAAARADSDIDDGVQVWEIGAKNRPGFALDRSLKGGFHRIKKHDRVWRVFVVKNTASGKRYAVAQKRSVSTEMAVNSALKHGDTAIVFVSAYSRFNYSKSSAIVLRRCAR